MGWAWMTFRNNHRATKGQTRSRWQGDGLAHSGPDSKPLARRGFLVQKGPDSKPLARRCNGQPEGQTHAEANRWQGSKVSE
jgi:hypothetical protein